MRNAAVMLVIKDGLILGVSRGVGNPKFGLPGGKCEPGEYIMDTAKRETFEETGLTVDSCSLIFERVEFSHNVGGEAFKAYCFYAHSWSGTIVPSHEGDVRWVTVEELGRGSFPEYNLKTVKVLKTLYPNINLK